MATSTITDVKIQGCSAAAYKVPTDLPESDGTLQWNSTTLVVVEVEASGCKGLGYTYGHGSMAGLIRSKLRQAIEGGDAMAVPAAWKAMQVATRNLGRPGLSAMAISAVDAALWDLKAKLLDLPLVTLLGQVHDGAMI